jgi:hypothetical protein
VCVRAGNICWRPRMRVRASMRESEITQLNKSKTGALRYPPPAPSLTSAHSCGPASGWGGGPAEARCSLEKLEPAVPFAVVGAPLAQVSDRRCALRRRALALSPAGDGSESPQRGRRSGSGDGPTPTAAANGVYRVVLAGGGESNAAKPTVGGSRSRDSAMTSVDRIRISNCALPRMIALSWNPSTRSSHNQQPAEVGLTRPAPTAKPCRAEHTLPD